MLQLVIYTMYAYKMVGYISAIIHQIFSLACDWSTSPNIPQLKLGGNIRDQQNSTSILMQMLQFDWLSYSYTISHQSAVAAGRPRNTKFLQFFRSFGRNFSCKQVIRFLRRLKEGHLRFLDFKNLKILKERVRA